MGKKEEIVEKYLNYVSSFIEKGKYKQALYFLKKVKNINPAETRIYKNLGLMNFHRGKFYNAIMNYQKALESNKSDAELYYYIGCAYYYSGQIDTAIKYFEKTLEVNPNFSQALYNLGLTYEIKKEHSKAFEYIQKAMRISPDVKEVVLVPRFLDKKEEEISLEDIGESLKTTLEKFIQLQIQNMKAKFSFLKRKKEEKFKIYFDYGVELQKEQRYGEAIKYFEKAQKIEPDNLQVLVEKGKSFYSLCKMDKAEECFKKVIEKDEYNKEANYYLGCIYQYKGANEKAIHIFKKIISFYPDYALAYYSIAECYEKIQDMKSSVSFMEKAVKLNPYIKDLLPQIVQQESHRMKQIKAYSERGFLFTFAFFLYLAILNIIVYILDIILEFLYAKEKYEKIYVRIESVRNKLKNYIKKIE